MPSRSSQFVLYSAGIGLIAAILSLAFQSQSPLGSLDAETTYCYDSVLTLSEKISRANCFTVSASGTFSRVFYSTPSELDQDVVTSTGAVIPGLWDGHGHLLQYGEFLNSVDLFGASSIDEVISRTNEYMSRHPDAGGPGEWIRGTGWDQAAFGRMPTAEDLEANEHLNGKYIMFDRVDVHCVWVSAAILDLLPDPLPEVPGGEIITAPGKGVFCDNAIDLVMARWPKPGRVKKTSYIHHAMQELNKVGLVGVHVAGVTPDELQLYAELAGSENWTMRIYAMAECAKRNTFCPDLVPTILRDDGLLSVRSVKLFADGALGSWGSAMLEPFSDRPDFSGSLLVNSSTLSSLTRSWAKAGFQVNIHAIGDLANRLTIDAFAEALAVLCPEESAESCQSRHRFRIEHAQIVHPVDQQRMFHMGIIPSIQPTHATSDMEYARDRLGQQRTLKEAYRMRSFIPLSPVLGSDFPVEPPNPLHGIYAAVTRKSPRTGLGRNGSATGWHEEETLTLEEALRGFTRWPARAAFLEERAGVIQAGAFADWVVLDAPLDETALETLRDVRVRETWVGGRRVYSSKGGRMNG